MSPTEGALSLRASDVVGLPPFLETAWEIITPHADLSRPVRWVHAVDDPRPAGLLQGQEFVLSTLSRFTEDRQDLLPALRRYVADLDSVQASALAVEVLADRPRLREALQTLAAQRQADRARELPILLFSQQVRFVEITEHFHRLVLAAQTAQGTEREAYDPLFEVSTQLFRDVLGGHSEAPDDIDRRAGVLGMLGAAQYRSLVIRFRVTGQWGGAERARAQQLVAQAVRTVSPRLQARALVGETPSKDVGVVLALPAQAREGAEAAFSPALREAVNEVRASGFVPAFTIAAGEPSSTMLSAVTELESALQVLRSLETLLPRADRFPGFGDGAAERGYWKAADLGRLGLLARVEDPAAVRWFVSAQLGDLRGRGASELRDLVRALASTTATKAEVAALLGISRPTLYARVQRLERLIGRPLNDETLQALHLALLMDDLHG